MIFGNVFFFEAIARAIPGVQVSDGEVSISLSSKAIDILEFL